MKTIFNIEKDTAKALLAGREITNFTIYENLSQESAILYDILNDNKPHFVVLSSIRNIHNFLQSEQFIHDLMKKIDDEPTKNVYSLMYSDLSFYGSGK